MKIDFIYTFDEGPQQRELLPFVIPIAKDKCTLIDFATANLNNEERGNLIKISCCIKWFTKDEKNKSIPKWYFESKGKIWVDDLELWRADRGVKSTVSKSYLKQFSEQNN